MAKIKDFKLGPTGAYPYGKVDEHDEGEIRIALAIDPAHGIVRMMFGQPTAWIGFPSSHARLLAAALIEKADELDKTKS